jgi:hypothetical protein
MTHRRAYIRGVCLTTQKGSGNLSIVGTTARWAAVVIMVAVATKLLIMGTTAHGAAVIITAVVATKLAIIGATAHGATVIITAVVAMKLLIIGATVIMAAAVVALNTINKFARLRGDRDNRSKQNRRASEAVPVAALSNLQQQTLPRDRRGALCELM